MTTEQELSRLVAHAFPVDPLPQKLFRSDAAHKQGDFAKDFLEHFAQKPWTEISTRDWRLICLSGGAFREYIEPSTFLYYVPSLFISALGGEWDDMRIALEEILPHNKYRAPRGEWWSAFTQEVTPDQRSAFAEFILYLRHIGAHKADLVIEELISAAEAIWSHS